MLSGPRGPGVSENGVKWTPRFRGGTVSVRFDDVVGSDVPTVRFSSLGDGVGGRDLVAVSLEPVCLSVRRSRLSRFREGFPSLSKTLCPTPSSFHDSFYYENHYLSILLHKSRYCRCSIW